MGDMERPAHAITSSVIVCQQWKLTESPKGLRTRVDLFRMRPLFCRSRRSKADLLNFAWCRIPEVAKVYSITSSALASNVGERQDRALLLS